MKSYLTSKDVTVEKTHDLTRINNICIEMDPDLEELSDNAELLSGYAVEIRYEPAKDLEFITEFMGVNRSKMLRELIDEGRKIKGVLHSYTGISFLPA